MIEDDPSRAFVSEWLGNSFPGKAPLLICVLIDPGLYRGEEETQFMDGAAAIMNIIYAAESLGLNSCWVNCRHQDEKKAEFLKYFDLDKSLRPISFVLIGYGNQDGLKPTRESVEYYLLHAGSGPKRAVSSAKGTK